MLEEFLHEPRIAYFSMEIALRSEIPTYAGGLGILAGDTLRAAVDLRLPLVAVSLVSRAGYFRQEIDSSGRQVEHPAPWDPQAWAQRLDARIAVRIEGRPVWIGAWAYVLESNTGGRAPVILLDTDLEENRPEDREITHHPPLEASGTSGMKAAVNGVPSLSARDGWWVEGHIEGVTGWAIDDSTSLYDKLEHVVLPLFYGEPAGWLNVMKGAIGKNACCFNSHHMMRRYATEAYLR